MSFGDFLSGNWPANPFAGGMGAPGQPTPTAAPGPAPAGPQPGPPRFRRVPIWPPFATLAADPSVVYLPRNRHLEFFGAGTAAGATASKRVNFSEPTIIWARNGGSYLPAGTAVTSGRSSRNMFRTYFTRSGRDLIDGTSDYVLADLILGSAQQPGLFAGNGLLFLPGTNLVIHAQALVDDVTVEIVLCTLEEISRQAAATNLRG
jgi:hypothetical protein